MKILQIILIITTLTYITSAFKSPKNNKIVISPSVTSKLNDPVQFGLTLGTGIKPNKNYFGLEATYLLTNSVTMEELTYDGMRTGQTYTKSTAFFGGGVSYLYDIIEINEIIRLSLGTSVGAWFRR